MLKAKSSEIIQSALFDINNQYDNQIDDIDTSLLVESALLIAFESPQKRTQGSPPEYRPLRLQLRTHNRASQNRKQRNQCSDVCL